MILEMSRGSYFTTTSCPERPRYDAKAPCQYFREPNMWIGPQFAARFRQERHPKGHTVFRHSQWRVADELSPNRDRRALQTPMDSLVVALDDLDRKICLELVQGQTRRLSRVLPP